MFASKFHLLKETRALREITESAAGWGKYKMNLVHYPVSKNKEVHKKLLWHIKKTEEPAWKSAPLAVSRNSEHQNK